MLYYKGYMIEQNPSKNAIIISMPQTMDSLVSTALPVDFDRKYELSNDELLTVLKIVAGMFE